ncbi:MAG: methylmalonyl Co-A mutase-associated GTPase MeaB [Actinomycetota bacterium]
MDPATLIDAASSGDPRALGRLCSAVEDGGATSREILEVLYPRGGKAWTTGITGAPGAGKSTLVSELVETGSDARTAVLAVDPSSPITGGAILGDRIRMGRHTDNDNVYIRSLASRGHLGGISTATPAIAACLDGLGFNDVIIETVGVGQSEVEIASAADTTVVVVTAGWGDSVQAAKAGFLEIADIFVVNKADRGGADATVKDIASMLDTGPVAEWRPPILQTVASEGTGIAELLEALRDHRTFLSGGSRLDARRRVRAAHDLSSALRASIDQSVGTDEMASELLDSITARSIDPWSAADGLLQTR